MNRLLIFIVALSWAAACPALAEEYWIAYEGDDFPENQGWTRSYGAGGADRWIDDGVLVLDGRVDIGIYDSYSMLRPIDPEPGELFIMRWRLKVEELSGWADPAVGVFSDESWSVAFAFSESRVINLDDLDMSAGFEPGVFHRFELRSSDMRSFELSIDDTLALTGDFVHVITASKVAWGDGAVGCASLLRWDYFEFGVIPEPSGALGIVAMWAVVFCIRRRDFRKRG